MTEPPVTGILQIRNSPAKARVIYEQSRPTEDRVDCWRLGFLIGVEVIDIEDAIDKHDLNRLGMFTATEMNHIRQSEMKGCISEFDANIHADNFDQAFANAKKGLWDVAKEDIVTNYG